MRRGRTITGVASIAAAFTLLLAPGALAASPSQIYQDYADGHLDGTYTQAELNAALKDATVQGYGGPVVQVVTPKKYCRDSSGNLLARNGNVVSSTAQAAPAGAACKHEAGVAPARYTAPAPVRATGTLPFTGAELGIFALIGVALVASGFLLRYSARGRSR